MNYSSLFLSNESIQSVLKSNLQKNTASLAKFVTKKDFPEKCEKCDYKTSIGSYMYKHNRIKHSDIKHKCTECNYTHTFPTKVRTHHRQVHLGVPRNQRKTEQRCRKLLCKDVGNSDCKELLHFLFFCVQCDFSTKRNDALKIHTKKVHEGLIESFPCNQCDFITNIKSSLKRHASGKHIEETMHERYKCDYEGCTYKTLYKWDLRTHIETKHEGIVRFRCEFMNCTYRTNDRKSLKEHTMRHISETAYKCNFCDKTFTRKRNYTRHIRVTHEGVCQFKCDYIDCNYGTNDKRSFEAHAVKHTGVKLYQCNSCDQTFSTELSKRRHIKKFHHIEMKHNMKVLKSSIPTEDVQSENCAIDDPTENKSCIINSEMFGELSTDPTGKLCVQQIKF